MPQTAKTKAKKPGNTSNLRGRDATTGRFITVARARLDKSGAVVEDVPTPGKGRKRRPNDKGEQQ